MYFVCFIKCFVKKKNYKQKLQALNDLMPVPGPDDDMIMPEPTPPAQVDLPDWGEWLASANLADAIEKLGTPIKTI